MTKKVKVDGGHGGHDTGAIGNGLYEKTITLALARRVADILDDEYDGVQASLTRSNDTFLSLSKRADLANDDGADFFLSIHINAGGGTGYEDFVYDGQKNGSPTDKSREKIHEAVVPVLKKYGIKNRGKKFANFAVLRKTKMQAVLVETLFIDDKDDAKLLKKASFLEDMAQAYAKGVAEVVGAKRKAKPKPKPSGKLHRVQVGAFGSLKNAEALQAKLKAAGYPAIIKSE